MIFVGAVLDHDLVAGVGVGLIPLSYFHILLLAVRTRYGLYVNAAVADIVNIRKGRGCNRSNNRHNCCRRQHPQSQIFSLHTKSSLLYIPSLSRSKKDTSFASAWRASRGVVPAFCTNSAQVFSSFYPPPPTFSMVIIYKIPPFYLFTFCRAGNAKTPFPCRSRQRKGVFMPGNRPGRAASQTKSSRMGVKMSSRMPASVQTQPCSTPSSFRMVSPARTVWVTPSTVNSKAPDTT